MSMMFRPPEVAPPSIGLRQLLGFGQGDVGLWPAVRAEQLATLARYVPFNTALMVANVAALLLVFDGLGSPRLTALWAGGMAMIATLWLRRWWRTQGDRAPQAVRATTFWIVSLEVAAFGAGWGLFMAMQLPAATVTQQVVLVLLSLAAMGACGFATAFLPMAAIALTVLIAAGTLLSIPAGSPLAHWIVALCFGTFALLVARGALVSTAELMARLHSAHNHDEASAMIALLLNEFEANGSDWLIEVDAMARLTHVSPRFAEVAGLSQALLLGRDFRQLLGSGQRHREARLALRQFARLFAQRRAFRDLVVPVMVQGETRWWSLSATPKRDAQGRFAGYRGVGSDVTDVRRSQQQIAHLARFDALTGLANRTLMREMIDAMLRTALRRDQPCALMFIDLDRFKLVNDTLGHASGDRLLRDVALRLRQAAGPEAQLGRLGGDEFALALPGCDEAGADAVAGAVVAALARPFVIDGKPVTIGASLGYAMGPVDGDSVDALLRCADLALYEVKANGRGQSCRFVPAIRARAEERRMLEFDLRSALAQKQLRLAFQPVVDAADERIVGFEALLRWKHPVLGDVPPLKFIPIAEESGAIIPIGAWVIAEACRWAARWPAHVRIAVNLSSRQFDDPALPTLVARTLAKYRVDPDRLELEITESLFLNEQPGTLKMLADLKALGLRFALDDFGTGYSSLGYLRKAAFSRIKIDRSFVARALNPASESAAIIQAIVALANSLGMATTAEGTETRAEFELIRDLGCGQVQGYLFGRPMAPEDATALVTPAKSRKASSRLVAA